MSIESSATWVREKASKPLRTTFAAGFAISLFIGCSGGEAKQAQPDDTESSIDQDEQIRLWQEGLMDLREKIKSGKEINFQQANNSCIYWTTANQGIVTVIKNPLVYTYTSGESSIRFIPFVQSSPEGPTVLNGPFVTGDGTSSESSSEYGFVHADRTPSYTEITIAPSIVQAEDPKVFPPAWLEDGNKRYAETQIIVEEDLPSVFSDKCEF